MLIVSLHSSIQYSPTAFWRVCENCNSCISFLANKLLRFLCHYNSWLRESYEPYIRILSVSFVFKRNSSSDWGMSVLEKIMSKVAGYTQYWQITFSIVPIELNNFIFFKMWNQTSFSQEGYSTADLEIDKIWF